jgi:iron(III) transport system substrate-binding protein
MIRSTSTKQRLRIVCALLSLTLVAGACGSDDAETTASTAAPTTVAPVDVDEATGLEKVCEAGVAEGTFVYAATIEPDNFARISAPFEERFPGIEIQLQSAREEDYAGQIITTLAAGGEPDIDLIYGSQDGLFPIISRDLLDTDFDWSSVGADPASVHGTNMIRLFVVGLGIAYNTNLGGPEDLPDTWEALIDEKYKGDLVVDPRGNPFDLLAIAWGAEATVDYVTRLSATVEPIVIRGGTAGMTEVIAGGALMTTSGRADSNAELQAESAPIDMHYMDTVPVRILYNGLYKDAKNKNAAACFAGWLATDEGKDAFEAVEFKANEFPPAGVPASATLVFVDSADDAERTSTTGQLIQEVIAPDFDEG